LNEELFSHIKNGDAYRSLISETGIAAILRKLEWNALHSAHYVDVNERKEREIDVVARRSWVHPRKNQIAHLQLFVECKSLASKQILLAELTGEEDDSERVYFTWPGDDDDRLRDDIRKIIAARGIDTMSVLDRFDEIAFPDGERAINRLIPDAPKATFRASAARESSRDNDAGPLWDGIREAFSAMNGASHEEVVLALENFRDELGAVEEPDADWALDRLKDAASTVMFYHPIVVTEAPLFRLTPKGNLFPVGWGRVQHARVGVRAATWIDVVHAEAFDLFAGELTAWYDRFFAKRKCERV